MYESDDPMIKFRAELVKQSAIESARYQSPYCIECGTQHYGMSLFFICQKCGCKNEPPNDREWKMILI